MGVVARGMRAGKRHAAAGARWSCEARDLAFEVYVLRGHGLALRGRAGGGASWIMRLFSL